MHAEHLERIGGHQPGDGAMRLATVDDIEGPVTELHDLVERADLLAIVGDLGEREVHVLDPGVLGGVLEINDTIGFRIGKRPQQDT